MSMVDPAFSLERRAQRPARRERAGERRSRSARYATVAYPGEPGAFAHLACAHAFAGARALAFDSLAEAVGAVRAGNADAVVVPCENLIAGRVPDVHLLLPESGLHVVGEHFERVQLHLAARPGARLDGIRRVHSHPVALQQVRGFLGRHPMRTIGAASTAAAASLVARGRTLDEAAIASREAAAHVGLEILCSNIEDDPRNVTRFYVLAARPRWIDPSGAPLLTTVLFTVRNRPGALGEAIGGFGENGVNLTRLESYLSGDGFVATRFLCEFEGDPDAPAASRAMRRLAAACTACAVLGTYPVSPTRPQPCAVEELS